MVIGAVTLVHAAHVLLGFCLEVWGCEQERRLVQLESVHEKELDAQKAASLLFQSNLDHKRCNFLLRPYYIRTSHTFIYPIHEKDEEPRDIP